MKAFVVFAAVVASASAGVVLNSPLGISPVWNGLGYGYSGQQIIAAPQVVAAPTVYAAPAVTATQTHAQDELGQYTYSYAGGPSAKVESKTFDGVTRGGYSYVDANGKLQTVNYVSDALGFRVAATNLPVAPAVPVVPAADLPKAPLDTPEVAAARAAHLAEVAKVKAAEPIAVAAPAPVAVVAPAPVAVLPQPVQDTPEVVAARAAHAQALVRAAAAAAIDPQ